MGNNIGWVYVLTNPYFQENILKIGYTDRPTPTIRADDLYTTGVPGKFEVMYAAKLSNAYGVEQLVHRQLRSYRISANREFFRCTIFDAIAAIKHVGGNRIIEEIDNRPEVVRAREAAIARKREEERRRAEVLNKIRMEELERERQKYDQERRLKLAEEKRRKEEARQQAKEEVEYAVGIIFFWVFILLTVGGIGLTIIWNLEDKRLEKLRERQPPSTIAIKHKNLPYPPEVSRVKVGLKVGSQLKVKDRDIYLLSCPSYESRCNPGRVIIPRNSLLTVANFYGEGGRKDGFVYINYRGKLCKTFPYKGKNHSYNERQERGDKYDKDGCLKWRSNEYVNGWVYIGN